MPCYVYSLPRVSGEGRKKIFRKKFRRETSYRDVLNYFELKKRVWAKKKFHGFFFSFFSSPYHVFPPLKCIFLLNTVVEKKISEKKFTNVVIPSFSLVQIMRNQKEAGPNSKNCSHTTRFYVFLVPVRKMTSF